MPSSSQSISSTTQLFLDIHDITNNLVIMKDGTTSIIISVDAMNFGLLAEEEQDGIIYAYAGLLNSLNYPIQVVIRSQTKDVTQYLTLLKEQEELAPNSLMEQRIRTYREFVSNLIHERNVLDKKFYVVIPAAAIELGLLPPQSVVPGSKPVDLSTVERSVLIEKAKSILEPKRDHLIAQFSRIGLFARELQTQEIIQLFYVSYNPEAAEGQEITDSSNYTTPLVKAGIQSDLAAQLPTVQPPAVQEPAVQPPVVETPAVQEPAVQPPVVETPAVQTTQPPTQPPTEQLATSAPVQVAEPTPVQPTTQSPIETPAPPQITPVTQAPQVPPGPQTPPMVVPPQSPTQQEQEIFTSTLQTAPPLPAQSQAQSVVQTQPPVQQQPPAQVVPPIQQPPQQNNLQSLPPLPEIT